MYERGPIVCTNSGQIPSSIWRRARPSGVPGELNSIITTGFEFTCEMQLMLFISAIILLLSAWSGKHTGSTINAEKEMEEVEKTLGMLKAIEPK